jgi:ribosomal protein L11 methylase PrmA
MDEIIFISLGLLVLLAALKMAFALLTGLSSFKTGGAMFTTTHRSKIKKILEAIPMHPGQVVYDLGCGDGRFLIAAAKRYKVKAIGFEINPWAYLLSRFRVGLCQANVSIHFQDFWKADLSEADIVFCYLFPDVMERLREKLSKELKAGAKVISCNFEMPGWKPEKIIIASHPTHTDPIFIYTNLLWRAQEDSNPRLSDS